MFFHNDDYIRIGQYIINDPSLVRLGTANVASVGNTLFLRNALGDVNIPIPSKYHNEISTALNNLEKANAERKNS